jgi:hypothetical protein
MASAFCTAGKKALLDAIVSHTWKAALYTNAATIDASTPAYTTTGEVANGSGYATGGAFLTGATTSSGSGTAWIDFDDVTWASAFFTARYLLIYDATDSNRAYAVIDFGSDKTGQGGDFTYQMPAANASNAQIRI